MTASPLHPPGSLGIGGQIGLHRGAYQTLGSGPSAQSYTGNSGWFSQTLPHPDTTITAFPACDYTGARPRKGANLRAGEITAYRAWRVREGSRLFSIAFDNFEWLPGLPAEGNPDVEVGYEFGHGIHAFKDYEGAEEYLRTGYIILLEGTRSSFWFVLGEVELWGTIHEHGLGYRAQFARPTRFLWATPYLEVNLSALRARFGITE